MTPSINFPGNPTTSRKPLLAVLTGVLLTASFPPGKLSFLAWMALLPLMAAVERESFRGAFRLGMVAGLVHYLTLIYWIVEVLGHYGNLPVPAAMVPLVLLSLYLSLYLALFAGLATQFPSSRFPLLVMSASWVGLEYARAKLLTGFPWCLLGHTQYGHPYLIQAADICGVYGLSFLIVFANGLIYRLLFRGGRGRGLPLKWEVVIGLTLFCATLAYGYVTVSRNRSTIPDSDTLRVSIIQGNIDQSLKWEPAFQQETMAVYLDLSRMALENEPDLVVWPETAVPFFFQESTRFAPRMVALANRTDTALLFGSPAYQRSEEAFSYRNRAYLIPPGNRPVQYYDKVHLVPFGEYVPLKELLFFIERLVPAAGDFKPGDALTPLYSHNFAAGVLICFEAIFPELARQHALKGANVLVNITNDAWFGMTSAPHQHLSMAVFRAVETKLPMVRAANTGISTFISSRGEVTRLSPLFERAVLTEKLALSQSPRTLYTRFGDVFPVFLLVLSAMWAFFRLYRHREGRRRQRNGS